MNDVSQSGGTGDFASALAAEIEKTNSERLARGDQPLTTAEIAAAIGKSTAAVYSYLRGERHPRPGVVDQLARVLSGQDAERGSLILEALTLAGAVTSDGADPPRPQGPVFIGAAEIAARQAHASELWILKWNRRFITASNDALYGALADALSEREDQPETALPKRHYVYPGPAVHDEMKALGAVDPLYRYGGDDLNAFNSMQELLRQVRSHFGEALTDEKLASLVKTIEVPSLADVEAIGIPRSNIGFFIIEYNSEGEKAYRRKMDLFVELQAPVEGHVRYSEAGGQLSQQSLPYWVEMEQEGAQKQVVRMRAALEAMRQREPSAKEAA